jgi:hypothetical protein
MTRAAWSSDSCVLPCSRSAAACLAGRSKAWIAINSAKRWLPGFKTRMAARGAIGNIYETLSFQEIQQLLPSIYEAIVKPAPSGEMFADGVRMAGLDVLAKNRIKEGLPLCVSFMEMDRWGKQNRITRCLESLPRYSGAARPLLPQLRQMEKDMRAHREAESLRFQIESLNTIIKNIESDAGTVELRSLE